MVKRILIVFFLICIFISSNAGNNQTKAIYVNPITSFSFTNHGLTFNPHDFGLTKNLPLTLYTINSSINDLEFNSFNNLNSFNPNYSVFFSASVIKSNSSRTELNFTTMPLFLTGLTCIDYLINYNALTDFDKAFFGYTIKSVDCYKLGEEFKRNVINCANSIFGLYCMNGLELNESSNSESSLITGLSNNTICNFNNDLTFLIPEI